MLKNIPSWTKLVLIIFSVGLILLETIARFVLGLGDPPLYVADPDYEYRCKPSSSFRRFGNQFTTNSFGMRSSEFPNTRTDDEIRILVLGDSIPNGGSQTDQSELATEIIKTEVKKKTAVEVVVANISAGSWCPANLLAYLKTYGTFDANIAVIILNRDDLGDFLRHEPLDPRTHPTSPPISATSELIYRYLVPMIKDGLASTRGHSEQTVATKIHEQNCSKEYRELLRLLQANQVETIVIYHPSQSEWDAQGNFAPAESFHQFKQITQSESVEFVSLAPEYSAETTSEKPLYRDNFHPNADGQRVIANSIIEILEVREFIRDVQHP